MSFQPRPAPDLGSIGEAFVADWLLSCHWLILHRRWHCRWGELDLIARHPEPTSLVSFVEVKVRSRGNWDANGLFAITPTKQAKLWKAAQLFLASNPDLADLPCRFDVALVACKPLDCHSSAEKSTSCRKKSLDVNHPSPFIIKAGYELRLQHYITNAFTVETD